jgi:uncharacterized protein involved in exopolysaccharide biosynthesis
MTEQMQNDEINLMDYWKILWRRKVMIISLFVVSVVVTMVVSFQLPKYYKSETLVLCIAPESGGLGGALSASPLAGALGSIGGLTTPADKILVYLKSRTVADMVIRKFDLLRVFNESKWDADKGAWKNPEKPPFKEDAIKKLNKSVTSFKKSKEGTITITVEWKDPKLTAAIANYYVVALAEFMNDKAVTTTVQVVDPAIPAEKKSWPIISVNMMLAGFLSVLIGVIISLVLERGKKKQF